MIDFSRYHFHPVLKLPADYEVYDFTQGYDENRILKTPYGIGKYNEKRKNMYQGELYQDQRDIHMGIDFGAPVGEPIFCFYEGEIYKADYNSRPLDYGYTLITKHMFDGKELYALYGHLSQKSIENKSPGQKIQKGEVLGWIGNKAENGGWNPHLHFQLSYEQPKTCDLPGVVHERDRAKALQTYPDPQLLLGNLY